MTEHITDLQFYPENDIRSRCRQSFPCLHTVKVTYEHGEETEKCWSSVQIYQEMVRLGKQSEIPGHIREEWFHFKQFR
jgi:hypothetical protein